MQPAWLAIYRNFDDDTLAALASVGLLRRAAKDVEAGKVAWDAPPAAAHALVRADGQLVRIGADGPSRATCDCPAPGICKHILAASLWLRGAPGDGPGAPAPDPLAEVAGLDPAALFKAAGGAAARKAGALFAEAGPVTLAAQGGVLVIELPELDLVCRYIAGAGFAGMVSEVPAASRAAMHLLALAAVWRQRGRAFDWPDKADSAPAAPADSLSAAERQFLERLRELVLEVCRTGWSHVSEIMPAQLRAFGMSARVESFPRLAGLLRTLAGSAELLARRDIASDERHAIKLAARIDALCLALGRATGDALQDLRGRSRRTFDGSAALELLPLGAHWWEQLSGARGLTISFWDDASQSIMQAVLARRDANDRGFSRATAWSTQALWQGAGSAQTLLDRTLRLEDARLSGDSRISHSTDTRASLLPQWQAGDQRWTAAGFDDWRAIAPAVRAGAGLRGQSVECLLLKPTSFDTPQLDEVRQILKWTLRDRNGLPLAVRQSCEARHHTRVANIEAWAASGIPVRAVLVRLDRDTHGGLLEPVSLIVESDGRLRAVALDYVAPAAAMSPTFASRIARMFKSKDASAPWTPGPAHLEWIDALLGILENKGMTGRLHVLGDEKAELQAIGEFLRATGLDMVADALAGYVGAPDAAKALSLVHLCQTCAELDTSFIYC